MAKVQFLYQFKILANDNNSDVSALSNLPTSYDYIRLGHSLPCILEWVIATLNNVALEQVISFLSKTTPILSILRTNLLDNKNTLITYTGELTNAFDVDVLRTIYG